MKSKKQEEKKKQLIREGKSESEASSIVSTMTFTDWTSYDTPSTSYDSAPCSVDTGGSFGGDCS